MANVSIDSIQKDLKQRQSKSADTQQRQKLKSVVSSGGVVSTKKSLSQKFHDLFLPKDVEDVKSYIIMDLIIPGIKNAILDTLSVMFFNEVRRGYGRDRDRNGRVSYGSYYGGRSTSREIDRKPVREARKETYVESGDVDYRSIVLRHRADAERVVDAMCERIEEFDSASVADLLDLVEVSGKFVDNNWGWTDTRDIGIRRVSNGYLIDVAEAKYIGG